MWEFLRNLQNSKIKPFPEIIGQVSSSWVSGSYLPAITSLQVVIAVILTSKDVDQSRLGKIFRFVGITTLLFLSDAKLVFLRQETSKIIDDFKHALPVSHDKHFPSFEKQPYPDYNDEQYNSSYAFEEDLLSEDEDEEQDDEG